MTAIVMFHRTAHEAVRRAIRHLGKWHVLVKGCAPVVAGVLVGANLLFELLDTDRDGVIDLRELRSALEGPRGERL